MFSTCTASWSSSSSPSSVLPGASCTNGVSRCTKGQRVLCLLCPRRSLSCSLGSFSTQLFLSSKATLLGNNASILNALNSYKIHFREFSLKKLKSCILNIPVPKRKVPARKNVVGQVPRRKVLVKKKVCQQNLIDNTHSTENKGNT